MKKILSFLLALVMVTLIFSGCVDKAKEETLYVNPKANPASDFEYEVFKIRGEKFVRITAYIGSNSEVIIPEAIDNLPVREISRSAFSPSNYKMRVYGVTSLVIPDTVVTDDTTKSYLSFESDSRIANIHLGKGITKLVKKAFYGISHLATVSGGENVEIIGEECFAYCSDLKNFNIGNKLKKIPKEAFYYCESLENLNFIKNVEYIGENSFGACRALKQLILPASLKEIRTDAFSYCENIKEVAVYCDLSNWDKYVLGDTQTEKLVIKEGVKKLDCEQLAYSNHFLERINIPASVEKIGDEFFSGFYSLKTVVFRGNAPKELGKEVFGAPNKDVKIYYKKGATGFKESSLAKDYTLVEY